MGKQTKKSEERKSKGVTFPNMVQQPRVRPGTGGPDGRGNLEADISKSGKLKALS